jgi:hypothetical protein
MILLVMGRLTSADTDTGNIKTEAKFSSHQLLQALSTPDSTALNSYIEKAIEITGPVLEITEKDKKVTIFLEAGKEKNYVICEMQPGENKKLDRIREGDVVNIKGVYKGILLDAILLNCILLENDDNS